MSQDEIEEFNEIFAQLHVSLKDKVETIMRNYKCDKERFTDIYRKYEFNLGHERSNENVPLEQDILEKIEEDLMKENQTKTVGKKSYQVTNKSGVKNAK